MGTSGGEEKTNGKVKTPAVLGAIIDLGNCLNLIDSEHLDLVKAAHKAYLELCKISGLEPAQNKGKDLRAATLTKRFLRHFTNSASRKRRSLSILYARFLSKMSRYTKMPACTPLITFKSVSVTLVKSSDIFCRTLDELKGAL